MLTRKIKKPNNCNYRIIIVSDKGIVTYWNSLHKLDILVFKGCLCGP